MTAEEKLLNLSKEQIDLLFSKGRYDITLKSLKNIMLLYIEHYEYKVDEKTKKSILKDFEDIEEYINKLTNYIKNN